MMVQIEHEARFRHGRRGRGRPPWAGGGDAPPPADDAAGWVAGRLPDGWYAGAPEVTVDRDEILVVGPLSPPEAGHPGAAEGRIARFREETREQRIEIAREADARYGRTVSWGATVGETRELFTTASVPVMTRLRQPERRVLDTLVDAGVARSRSDALAWCVRLVGQHQEEWIASLRDALVAVEEARARGPEV
ncbi:MAG TPA: hypothetical protein VNQ77_12875 [Frankiaceae bacterium]|nr:hypothetical protein [Frankiaceae bacterium]